MVDVQGLVCVAVGVKETSVALQLIEQESALADVIEIRLDGMNNQDVAPFLECDVDIPLLFTNRPAWEGGYFTGDESTRIIPLELAIEGGAAYVDCELRAPETSHERLKKKLSGSQTKLILSWHDFEMTPDERVLHGTVLKMHECSADIGKIVTTAHDYLDVLRVMALQELARELEFPLIAFCMGDAGMISRLASLKLGGYMSYCSPRGADGTAAGQLDADQIKTMLGFFCPGS